MASNRLRLIVTALSAGMLLSGCIKNMKPPEQGIYGTFKTYGPPKEQVDCTPFKTQMEKDECRRMNNRVIEEPHQATIKVRNLQTREIQSVQLDADGSYRILVTPGEYEVCLEGECSDPMTVRMGAFVPYGQNLPRAAPAPAGKAPAADTLGRSGEASRP